MGIFVGFLLLFLQSFNLYAQEDLEEESFESSIEDGFEEEETSEAPPPEREEKAEKIEITGSRIKQVEMQGHAPVLTLDRQYLDRSGYNAVGDVLRELTTNSFGSWREKTGESAGGVSEVSLRGLGATRTLVLINGRRTAKDGTRGTTDLNLIPMAAIEKIDVLKDSSSAIYGTDAVGGVVNIITKKNYSGVEFSASRSRAELKGGDKTTFSGVIGGHDGGGTRTLTTIQYRSNGEIYTRDREWLHTGVSVFSPIPNIIANDKTQALAHCPSDKLKDGLCRFRWTDYATETPKIEQFNLYTNVEHQIDASTEFHFELFGTYKKYFSQYAPGVVNLLEEDNALERNDFINGLESAGVIPAHENGKSENIKVLWRALMLGPRITREKNTAFSINTGVRRALGETWEMNFSLGTERIKRDQHNVNGYAKAKELTDAIQNGVSLAGTPCDIFSPDGTCNIKDEVFYAPYQIMHSELHRAELMGSGELIEHPYGTVMAAMGINFSVEKFSDNYDDLSVKGGVLGGGSGSEGHGDRKVWALFTEFSVPMFQELEFNLAGRYDHYSDFGDTFNPKASLLYRPVPWFLLRASGGGGFKAPDMNVLYARDRDSYPDFVDVKGCDAGIASACSPTQYLVRNKRPKGLKEETTTNFNVGAIIQATNELSLGVDIFYVNIKDRIGTDFKEMTAAELDGVDLSEYHTTINRNPQGEIVSIETQDLNIGEDRLTGADFELKFKTIVPAVGTIAIGNTMSYLFQYKSQGFAERPLKKVLEEYGKPQWRNMLVLGYEPMDSLQFSSTITTVGKHSKEVAGSGNFKAHTSVNAQAGFNLGKKWGKLTLGAENLFDSRPPVDTSNPNFPVVTDLYSNRGRTITLGYTVNF